MFHNFEPVLNNFDVPASYREAVNEPDGLPTSALTSHFDLIEKGLKRADFAAQLNSALDELATGRSDVAVSELRRLQQQALRADDAELAEVVCHNLAAAYREGGDFSTASSWQQQSIAWWTRRSLNDRCCEDDELARLACDLTGRGADEFACRRFDIAKSLWQRALAIEEWRGDLEGQAADCGNLGLLAATQGDIGSGVRWLKKSLRLHRLMFDKRGVGTDLLNLAELFRLLGQFRRSLRCVRRAVWNYERAEAVGLLVQARTRLREASRIVALSEFDSRLN